MEDIKKEFDESIVEETAEETVDTVEEAAESETEETEATKEEATEEVTDEDVAQEKKTDKKKKKKSSKVLENELEKSEAKVAELTDRYQRLMAEFENARKRMAKESGQKYDMGAMNVLEKLLPVVDNFERGLSAVTEEEKETPFVQGVEAIYKQLMTIFEGLGVAPMDAAGKEFDPNLHNAVMHVEDPEMGENLVAEEFQKGYMYKDSVLRFSMVKVVN